MSAGPGDYVSRPDEGLLVRVAARFRVKQFDRCWSSRAVVTERVEEGAEKAAVWPQEEEATVRGQ